jgi:hypothetical protein
LDGSVLRQHRQSPGGEQCPQGPLAAGRSEVGQRLAAGDGAVGGLAHRRGQVGQVEFFNALWKRAKLDRKTLLGELARHVACSLDMVER